MTDVERLRREAQWERESVQCNEARAAALDRAADALAREPALLKVAEAARKMFATADDFGHDEDMGVKDAERQVLRLRADLRALDEVGR